MADGRLTEPLIADTEGLDFRFLDESILKELKQLDDAESGWAVDPAEHVEDEDVLRMKQLIREKPKDVIQVHFSIWCQGNLYCSSTPLLNSQPMQQLHCCVSYAQLLKLLLILAVPGRGRCGEAWGVRSAGKSRLSLTALPQPDM